MPSAERVNWAKFRVAAVIAVAVAILSVLVYLLSGGTIFEQKATIYLYIPDATGLGHDSPVRVDGIGVGKVDSVSLSGSAQPQRVVRVVMRIEKKNLAKIPADSYGQLNTDTLIGDKFVDITSGTRPESLRPNSELTYKEDVDVLKTLDLQQFQQRLRVVDALLTDIETGRSRVGQFILQEDMYHDLMKEIGEIEQAIHTAAETTSAIGQELYTDKLYRRISDPVIRLDQALAAIQSGQGAMGRLLRDSGQYEGILAAVQSLRKSVAQLRANDFMQSDRLYSSLVRTLTRAALSVDEFNAGRQFGTSAWYDNLNGKAKELEQAVRDFRQHPRKYLRLELF